MPLAPHRNHERPDHENSSIPAPPQSSHDRRRLARGEPARGLRWFILRPGQPVSVRVVDAATVNRTTIAEAVFANRPDGPGTLVLSVVRGWGPAPRLDLFWHGTGPEQPDQHGYSWSVTDSGSLHVTANGETVIEYGPGAWQEWQPSAGNLAKMRRINASEASIGEVSSSTPSWAPRERPA